MSDVYKCCIYGALDGVVHTMVIVCSLWGVGLSTALILAIAVAINFSVCIYINIYVCMYIYTIQDMI